MLPASHGGRFMMAAGSLELSLVLNTAEVRRAGPLEKRKLLVAPQDHGRIEHLTDKVSCSVSPTPLHTLGPDSWAPTGSGWRLRNQAGEGCLKVGGILPHV